MSAGAMQKVVRKIPPNPEYLRAQEESKSRPLRTAAYCRVSTDSEEQEHSYEAQKEFYTDMIMKNPKWRYAEIFADEGITGTSTKRRKDFKRMISWCNQGKIDLIITKSVSRFARNTVDSLHHVRLLKAMNIGVIFEKEGINTLEVSNEFLLTIHSSLAQAESESHSGNVRLGKRMSAKQGSVAFHYKTFLGYRRGADGDPEIDPDQAKTIIRIYERFLAGASRAAIAQELTADGIPTPMHKEKWSAGSVNGILRNEKYMGDAILQKTFVEDCMTKKIKVNVGQLPKYYVENNHPAIIDKDTWNLVQEELARRSSKRKVKEVGTKTEQGKYSGKYALTELLYCGECGTPYRRCTWNIRGKKKIVWRCISRLDYGKKYCKGSPTLEEYAIHDAVVAAIREYIGSEQAVLDTAKMHIGMGISGCMGGGADNAYAMRQRVGEIEKSITDLITLVSKGDGDDEQFDGKIEALASEKRELKTRIARMGEDSDRDAVSVARVNAVFSAMDDMLGETLEYDDVIVRQIIESVKVVAKDRLRIAFRLGGTADAILPK